MCVQSLQVSNRQLEGLLLQKSFYDYRNRVEVLPQKLVIYWFFQEFLKQMSI